MDLTPSVSIGPSTNVSDLHIQNSLLFSLPWELISKIFQDLNMNELNSARLTCKSLNTIGLLKQVESAAVENTIHPPFVAAALESMKRLRKALSLLIKDEFNSTDQEENEIKKKLMDFFHVIQNNDNSMLAPTSQHLINYIEDRLEKQNIHHSIKFHRGFCGWDLPWNTSELKLTLPTIKLDNFSEYDSIMENKLNSFLVKMFLGAKETSDDSFIENIINTLKNSEEFPTMRLMILGNEVLRKNS